MKEPQFKIKDALSPNKVDPRVNRVNLDELCYFNILQNQYADQAIKLITQSFCRYEPMTRYLRIAHHEFIPFAAQVVKKAVRDGLSVGVTIGNKLVACAIVEDCTDPLTLTHEIDPRFKFIFALLNDLSSGFLCDKVFEKNHLAHLFMTAVDPNYHGEGLSRKVNLESIKLAKARNFDFMCCEFSHHYNEKGTMRNITSNKLMIGSHTYKDFVVEGEKPFEHLEGSANAYIWELREEALLSYRSHNQNYCHSLKDKMLWHTNARMLSS